MTLLGLGAMLLDRASREFVYLDIEADRDLGPLTLEVQVGDDAEFQTWDWTAAATTTGAGPEQRWKRTARRLLAGPDASDTSAGVLVLPSGLHEVRWRPAGGDESPVRRAGYIDVS